MRLRILSTILLTGVAVLCGCGVLGFVEQKERDKAAIRAAIEKYLNERGTINLSAMTWEISEFSQDRDRATVQVVFTSKQGGAQMPVTYEVRRENGVWAVKKSGSSAHPGAAAPTPPAGQLPPGHSDVGGSSGAQAPAPPPPKRP
jgi:hypothetical protein